MPYPKVLRYPKVQNMVEKAPATASHALSPPSGNVVGSSRFSSEPTDEAGTVSFLESRVVSAMMESQSQENCFFETETRVRCIMRKACCIFWKKTVPSRMVKYYFSATD